jgi:glyoxalase superfamily protein
VVLGQTMWRPVMTAFEKTIPILRIFSVEKAKEFYVGGT